MVSSSVWFSAPWLDRCNCSQQTEEGRTDGRTLSALAFMSRMGSHEVKKNFKFHFMQMVCTFRIVSFQRNFDLCLAFHLDKNSTQYLAYNFYSYHFFAENSVLSLYPPLSSQNRTLWSTGRHTHFGRKVTDCANVFASYVTRKWRMFRIAFILSSSYSRKLFWNFND